jgi:hypothetical protein
MTSLHISHPLYVIHVPPQKLKLRLGLKDNNPQKFQVA